MQPIGSQNTTPYTTKAPPSSLQEASSASDKKASFLKEGTKVQASSGVVIKAPKHDLTNIKPNDATQFAAQLFEDGVINIHQMVGVFAIAGSQMFPPVPGGVTNVESINHDPFNLMEKVQERSENHPAAQEYSSLLEIFQGYQNRHEISKYSSINIEV